MSRLRRQISVLLVAFLILCGLPALSPDAGAAMIPVERVHPPDITTPFGSIQAAYDDLSTVSSDSILCISSVRGVSPKAWEKGFSCTFRA